MWFFVCKDSYMIYACDFDRVGKWLGLMRMSRKRMILRHVCHLAVDHWRRKTLVFLCDSQCVNLSDLQTILKWLWGKSCWFRKQFGNDSGINFNESWWFVNHSEFFVGQISVIHEPPWNDSTVNLSKSQCFVNHYEMILGRISRMHKTWFLIISAIPMKWFVNHWESSGIINGDKE